ncbi:MAG: hypothetical protein DRG78_04425 [Epsilonproteobacteria bacterium]|nr:MAG: hypothetical protein DRG78_04425 [Campylobacterota bacterium]
MLVSGNIICIKNQILTECHTSDLTDEHVFTYLNNKIENSKPKSISTEIITDGVGIKLHSLNEIIIPKTSNILIFNRTSNLFEVVNIKDIIDNIANYKFVKQKKYNIYKRIYEIDSIKLIQELGEILGLWLLFGSYNYHEQTPSWFLDEAFRDYFEKLCSHINKTTNYHLLIKHTKDNINEFSIYGQEDIINQFINKHFINSSSEKIIPNWIYNAHESFIYGIFKVLTLKMSVIQYNKKYKKYILSYKNKNEKTIIFLKNILNLRFEGTNIFHKKINKFNFLTVDVNSKLLGIFKSISLEFPKDAYKVANNPNIINYDNNISLISSHSAKIEIYNNTEINASNINTGNKHLVTHSGLII